MTVDENSQATEATYPRATLDEQARADPHSAPDPKPGRARSYLRTKLIPVLLAVALTGSACLAAWLYFFQYSADRQTDHAAAQSALNAAKAGTVALLSYSPEQLDKDFAAAESRLTGDFLSYYTQFTQNIVSPAAKQKSIKTTASVERAAVSELRRDSAVVLVFVNQTTTSRDNPDGAYAASAVKVGMKKINGTWLISSFDPV